MLCGTAFLRNSFVVYPGYSRGKKKADEIAVRMTGRFPTILAFAFGKCPQQLLKKPNNVLLIFMVIKAFSHLTSFVSIFLQQQNRI